MAPRSTDSPSSAPPRRAAGLSLLVWGGVLIALAGHYRLIQAFGTMLPYRDSWQLTGVDLLGPWLDGELSWRAFLQPLNDHWPVLTRLLSFGLVRLNGQWNNLLEVVVNATILGAAIGVFLTASLREIPVKFRVLFAAIGGAVFALPITWENTLWGIQSLPYFQILLSMFYFRETLRARDHGRWWMAAQLAGGLLLFTQHSAILAQVAILPVLAWRWARRDGSRGLQLHSMILAVIALAGFAWGFPALEATAQYKADSVAVATGVALHQLAWPTGNPACAFLLWAPWLILVFRTFGQRTLTPGRAFLIVTGLWVGGQAVAIGYGRGILALTNVSRYGDFLSIGLLVNLAAAFSLWSPSTAKRWLRIGGGILLVGWILMPLRGLWHESVHSHTGYNLALREEQNAANLDRVASYLKTRDPAALALEQGGATLFTYPPAVAALLDREGFRALMPPETGAAEARSDHGRLGFVVELFLWQPGLIGMIGVGLLLVGGRRMRRSDQASSEGVAAGGPQSGRGLICFAGTMGGLAVVFTGLWAMWPSPLNWRESDRLRQAFTREPAVGNDQAWSFKLDSPHESDPTQLAGAVLAFPVEWRPFAYGTVMDQGLGNRGIFVGQAFLIERDYVALLFSGYPCSAGNGLRWKLHPPAGGDPVWLAYQGPNPISEWHNWVEDLRAYQGWKAQLYIYDGRDDAEGWIGVMAPLATDDRDHAESWLSRLHIELTLPALRVVGTVALVSWGLTIGLLVAVSCQRKKTASG